MKNTQRLFHACIIAFGVIFLVGFLLIQHFQEGLHQRLSTYLYSTATQHTNDVVVVKIDPKSLAAQSEGGLGRWQTWKRGYYATVIDNLKKAGARTIGVDIFFSEPSHEEVLKDLMNFSSQYKIPDITKHALEFSLQEDTKLANILKQHDVILAAKAGVFDKQQMYPAENIVPTDYPHLASIEVYEDNDNLIRKAPLFIEDQRMWASFPLKIVSRFLGVEKSELRIANEKLVLLTEKIKDTSNGKNYGPLTLPVTDGNFIYTNFFGRPYTIPTLSFVDVYNNTFQPKDVAHKIVLIGEMDSGLHDELYTPVSYGSAMPGVEFHANVIETMLTGIVPTEAPFLLNLLIIICSTILITCVTMYLRPWIALLVSFFFIPLFFTIAIIVFSQSYTILNLVHPILAIILSYICVSLYKYFVIEKEKKKALHAFSHYVSRDVVQKIMKDPSKLALGGEKKQLAVAFTDIAGFTTLSETVSPDTLVSFLHDYLHEMTGLVIEHNGTLDKYIGDALMYFWNAPLDNPTFALDAQRCILAIHERLPIIAARWSHIPAFASLDIRTGLTVGENIVGNFGSKERFDYTVIGDKVNLASRLEGVNKEYHSHICVDEDAYQAGKAHFLYRELDTIRVKGKNVPIRIYELLNHLTQATTAQTSLATDFANALSLYKERHFLKAKKAFMEIYSMYSDPVAYQYAERCTLYVKHPPEKDWDFVFTMTTK